MDEKKFCPRCGSPVKAEDRFCPKCGADLTSPDSSTPNNNENAIHETYEAKPADNSENSDDSTAALVFGILAIALGGYLWGILALVFAGKNPNGKYSKTAKTLAIIGMVFWTVLLVLYIVLMAINITTKVS